MAEGRKIATDCRHARQLAFMGATGISGAWKVQVCGATWCMVEWARAIFELLPSLTRRIAKGRPPFGRSPYGKPRIGAAAGSGDGSVDDDGRAGRRPVPEPDHLAPGNIDAAVSAGVLPGGAVMLP